jgi:hypothetical protein
LREQTFSLVQGARFDHNRDSVIELQTFIAVLVNKFHFAIAPGYSLRKEGCNIVVVSDTPESVALYSSIYLQTPMGRARDSQGPWMPLLIQSRSVLGMS